MNLTDEQKIVLEGANLPLLLLLEAEEINSDDENDASQESEQSQDAQGGQGGQDTQDQGDEPDQEEEPEPTPEESFAFELEGTEDKFMQFVLYDKLTGMNQKITILQDNIKNDSSVKQLELTQKLDHYQQYLNVLNELIFSISTSVVYKILGQIELELIDILQVYNGELEKHMALEELKK